MNYLHGKSILVTGGTGSFGKSFVREILNSHGPRRVAIFSRDELKQSIKYMEDSIVGLLKNPKTASKIPSLTHIELINRLKNKVGIWH